jgi:O-6-methylguanine DNA methyltransferase
MTDTDTSPANPYWTATQSIPAGETRTFQELAALVSRPRAARAAGRAIASCPLTSSYPWQRVVSSNGALAKNPGRAYVQLERLRAEGARPLDGESNAAFAERVGKPWLGTMRGRRFAPATDARIARVPGHVVEAFATVEDARARRFEPFEPSPAPACS